MEALRNENLIRLVGHFEKSKYQIRIVGGAVRDHLQGMEPKDIDLCTDADPQEMIELGERFGLQVVPTGLQHGTVTFVVGGEPFEVTTLRIDTETDGRHATVEFTRDFEKDAERRDLTINAMSMDIDGNLFDYFGGQDDLKRNRLRFVGEARDRVREDYLRVLRYFRFAAKLDNFDVPRELAHLFFDYDTRQGLAKISGERIWAELNKTIRSKNGWAVLMRMIELGTLESVGFKKPTEPYGMHDPKAFWNQLQHENKFFPDSHEVMKEALVMGILATCWYSNDAQPVVDRLKFSVRERKAFEFMVRFHSVAHIFTGSEREIFTWFHSRCAEGHDPQVVAAALAEPIGTSVHVPGNQLDLIDRDGKEVFSGFYVPFTVTGQDLIRMGVKPGPNMGMLLRAMRQFWSHNDCCLRKERVIEGVLGETDPAHAFAVRLVVTTAEDIVGKDLGMRWKEDTIKREDFVQQHKGDPDVVSITQQEMHMFVDSDVIVTFKSREAALMKKLEWDASDLFA